MIDIRFEDKMMKYSPIPAVVINLKGKVVRANDKIGQVFVYDDIVGYDFFQLTGYKVDELKEAIVTGELRLFKQNDKTFRLFIAKDYDEGDEEDGNLFAFFYDVTS